MDLKTKVLSFESVIDLLAPKVTYEEFLAVMEEVWQQALFFGTAGYIIEDGVPRVLTQDELRKPK